MDKKELIEVVLNNKEIAEECLRELLVDVLTNLKTLNARKIDNDIEGLKNGTSFDELFVDKETSMKMYEYSKMLTMLIKVAKNGIEKTFEELDEVVNDNVIPKEYTSFLESVVNMYCRYVNEKLIFLNNNTENGGAN